jgi:hypothetical protein
MDTLISLGMLAGLIGFFVLFFTVFGFFMKRYYDKKNAEERYAYPAFYRTYETYSSTISEQLCLEREQREIMEKIEAEQAIMNCFPLGPDHDAHCKKVDELRYSYLCKQGAIDIKKMERKELATKLNSLSKPERFNHVYH